MKAEYRITERIFSDETLEFIPEKCQAKEYKSKFCAWLHKRDKKTWQSIADFHYRENDRGYSTIEEAQECILIDVKEVRPEIVAVLLIKVDVA